MPRIINAYADNASIADSLAKLGESIFGDQAKNEVFRQKAFGAKRENDNIPLLADAVARGARDEIARYGVMSNKTGQDTGDFNRLGVSNHASGVDDPRLALATMGAGGAFSSTAPGQGRDLANRTGIANIQAGASRDVANINAGQKNYEFNNTYEEVVDPETNKVVLRKRSQADGLEAGAPRNRVDVANIGAGAQRDVAHIQADKQAASDRYKFDNTFENTYDPATGRTVLTPRSQAAGREIAPTKDSYVGGMLRRVAEQQQPGAFPENGTTSWDQASTAPRTAPADPFGNLSPRMQKIAGVDLPEQSLVEPRSGMTGISRDGGVTVILPNGQKIPATGFQPVGQETALGQARDNNVRAAASQPLAVPDPTKSAAAADASQASGVGAFVQKHANAELGALPGASSVIKAVTGSPEIAPGTQRAQSQLDVRNNAARTVLLGAPGRQTVQAQQWVNQLLPQGGALANPATEAAKIPTIVNALKADYQQIQQAAQDPNTVPADRVKMVQQLRQIENTIRLFTDPPPQAAPAAPAAAPAQPAAAAQPQVPVSQPQQPAAPPPPAPKIGEMRDGHAFQGGNPADPNSWMKVQ